jgi:hypothetical protein
MQKYLKVGKFYFLPYLSTLSLLLYVVQLISLSISKREKKMIILRELGRNGGTRGKKNHK